MLRIPETGLARSVNKHRCDLVKVCDWIEASILFAEETVSRTDIVDILLEENVYADQDFAKIFIDDIWQELRRRCRSLGAGASVVVHRNHVEIKRCWGDHLAYAFCLLISLRSVYTDWSNGIGDYITQGSLFERLASESFQAQGWTVYEACWSPESAGNIEEIVCRVGEITESAIRADGVAKWFSDHANDGSLDLVCCDPYYDGRGAYPVVLVQCASGDNWTGKTHTPELSVWSKVIEFTASPMKSLAIPFALSDKDFLRMANRVNGLFVDRFRLASPSFEDNTQWLSAELANDMRAWMTKHVTSLVLL